MANVFIFTSANQAAQDNFKKTIENGYDLSEVMAFIGSEDEKEKLRNIYPDNKCYLWGAQEKEGNNRRIWEQMTEGDLVLGYRSRSIVSASKVVTKIDNPELSEKVWGKYPEGPFRLIYFLSKPYLCDVPVSSLPEYFGQQYQAFTRIKSESSAKILRDYSTFDNFINQRLFGMPPVMPRQNEPERSTQMKSLIQAISSQGFVFEPWQIAAYITALQTKPFVILAGVTGTGKSKLPKLVSEATGGVSKLISVRPDWTDSSDVLGYCSLNDKFRPGQLLEFVQKATESPGKHHVCIVDEMNIARVEHYFAEILSRIEDRRKALNGGFESSRLLGQELSGDDAHWSSYGLPSNLAIVGTVNMDESAHGFSRKVLDRAFTIELSDIDLTKWESVISEEMTPTPWPVDKWHPRAIQLSQLGLLSESERKEIDRVIKVLTEINSFLVHAQLQVGYRSRDEIAMFVMHAQDYKASFVTNSGVEVDPLDLALLMKVLPRIVGGSSPVRRAILQLLGWAVTGKGFQTDEDAKPTIDLWESGGRPGAVSEALYPRTAARLCLMWDRLLSEGFTSFWL